MMGPLAGIGITLFHVIPSTIIGQSLHGAVLKKPSGIGALDILGSAPVLHEEFLCHGL